MSAKDIKLIRYLRNKDTIEKKNEAGIKSGYALFYSTKPKLILNLIPIRSIDKEVYIPIGNQFKEIFGNYIDKHFLGKM